MSSSSFLYNSSTSFGGSAGRKSTELCRSFSDLNTSPVRYSFSHYYDIAPVSYSSFKNHHSSNANENSVRAVSINRVYDRESRDYDRSNSIGSRFTSRIPCSCGCNNGERSRYSDRSVSTERVAIYGSSGSSHRSLSYPKNDDKCGSSTSINVSRSGTEAKDSDYETVTEIYSSTEIIDQIGSNRNTYTSLPVKGDFSTQVLTKVTTTSPAVVPAKPTTSILKSSASTSSLQSTKSVVISNKETVSKDHSTFKSTIRPMPNVSTLVAPLPPPKPWPIKYPFILPGLTFASSRQDVSENSENVSAPAPEPAPAPAQEKSATPAPAPAPVAVVSESHSTKNNDHEVEKVETITVITTSSSNGKHHHHHHHHHGKHHEHQQSSHVERPAVLPTVSRRLSDDQNELAASAVSNIKLSLTDDLTTQVDYLLNEADNRMICSGRQVELESFDLQLRSGLISKCLFVNDLLAKANLNETNLDADPVFAPNGKAILLFLNKKDAESFASFHSSKFNITHNPESDKSKTLRKNVSFSNDQGYSVNISSPSEEDLSDENKNKSILKKSSSTEVITGKTRVGFNVGQDAADILTTVSADPKKNKNDAYEILTIRAKLKQRVDQNRTKQVSLGDVDLIMRNVVTIIQDEFMKRFPSGQSNAIESPTSQKN